MFDKIIRAIRGMELEEQILHGGVVICALGVFFPWFGGQWFGDPRLWNGFQFYTGYIGIVVFGIQLFILFMMLSPLAGGPVVVKRQSRNFVRLLLTASGMMLILAAFTVLLRVSFDMAGAEIRWGIYLSFIGGAVALLYSLMRYREQVRNQVQEMFHHPDEVSLSRPATTLMKEDGLPPPPPPPPPPMPAEDHNLFHG